MIALTEPRERYLELFQRSPHTRQMGSANPPWLINLRQEAIDRFACLGFPTTRDEEWRFTNIAPIATMAGKFVGETHLNGLATGGIDAFKFRDLMCSRLTFVNGRYSPELSLQRPLPTGVRICSLAEAIAQGLPEVRHHLAEHANFKNHAFTALNTAFMEDGAYIEIPNGVQVEEPIHLLYITTSGATPTLAHPRNLIVAGSWSQCTVIEHYVCPGQDVYFNNPVTEVSVGNNAVVDHYKVQKESPNAYHVSRLQAQQERSATFSSLNITFGGRLTRNDAIAVMGGSGIECTLNGLFLIGGEQHVDNHTLMDHARPRCNSHELYAGVLDGNSRGVFNGKILVQPEAQKTDAKQTNRNLLLSRTAQIDTKPQLEIFADDVKCTHGATVGQLDEDALFYLRARGIPLSKARDLLVYAFANEVLGGIKVEPLRAALERELVLRLSPALEEDGAGN